MTTTISGTNGIDKVAPGAVERDDLPAGTVLQVVTATTTTETTTSSSSFVDTTLTATITPSSATSKILVLVNHTECEKTAGSSVNRMGFALLRNGTSVTASGTISSGNLYTGTALLIRGTVSFSWLDSPASTSALTYKTQFKSNDGTSSVTVQVNTVASPSTITLMEISA